jgi:hypothetical protein
VYIVPLLCLAQGRNSVSWGHDLKEPARSSITELIGVAPDGFFALREQNIYRLRPYIERYDRNFALTHLAPLDLRHDKQRFRTFERVLYTGVGLFLFSSYQNNETATLYVESIDVETVKPKNDLREVMTIALGQRDQFARFQFALSVDSSKILALGELVSLSEKPKLAYMHVFEATMQLELWQKTAEMPTYDALIALEHYEVDNYGNAYLLVRRYYDRAVDRRKGRPNYEFRMLSYRALGMEEKSYTVHFQEYFINDLTFRLSPTGAFLCAGFYSEKSTRTSIRGVFSFAIAVESGEMYQTHYAEFPYNFLNQFMSARRAKHGAELPDYLLRNFVLRSDGGAVLVAEQYFVTQFQAAGVGASAANIHFQYFYNDVIVVSIAPDGGIEWCTKIPKHQQTLDDMGYYSSYAMAIISDKMYFIFNDHVRNLTNTRPNRLRTFNGRHSVVMLATISADGTLEKTPLLSNREQNIITRPQIAKQMNTRIMLLYGENGNRYKFGRIIFEDE